MKIKHMLFSIIFIGLPLFQILSYYFFLRYKPKWAKFILPIALGICFFIVASSYFSEVYFKEPNQDQINVNYCGNGFVFALYIFGFILPIAQIIIHTVFRPSILASKKQDGFKK